MSKSKKVVKKTSKASQKSEGVRSKATTKVSKGPVKKATKSVKVKTYNDKPKKSLLSWPVALAIIVLVLIASAIYIYQSYEVSQKETLAVIVNGQEITMADVDFQQNQLEKQFAQYPEAVRPDVSRQTVLDNLIRQTLLIQAAKNKGINVTEEDIDAEVQITLDQYTLTYQQLLDEMAKQDITESMLRKNVEDQLYVINLIQLEFDKDYDVTDGEIEAFYQANMFQYVSEEEIRASHILVCYEGSRQGCPENRTLEEAEVRALEVLEKLNNGDSFAELAAQYSDGPTATTGGDLGFFKHGDMIGEFEDVAFRLQPNETAQDPVLTAFGYHIITVTDRKAAELKGLNIVEEEIRQQLIIQKQQNEFEDYVTVLVDNAEIQVFDEEYNKPSVVVDDELVLEDDVAVVETPELKDESMLEVNDEMVACAQKNKIDESSIIFVYTDSCTFCQNMKPIVQDLSKDYSFEMVNAMESESQKLLKSCFEELVTGSIPQVICPKYGTQKTGALNKEELTEFANSCV